MKEHPMDDTEEAARRLFAVATADVPPGIDLLRGVRARSRGRVVRIRSLVAVGAAGIVAAATAITLSAVQAPSAFAQVVQAAQRTAAYQVSTTSTLVQAPLPGAGSHAPVSGTGEFDPASGVGEETNSHGVQVRYVGGYIYLPVTDALRTALNRLPHLSIPAGVSWLRAPRPQLSGVGATTVELTTLGSIAMGVDQVDPQNLLSLLESATQVREVGPASGTDWTGSQYAFTASMSLPGPVHTGVSMTGTVGVDQQGRVRQFDAVESLAGAELKVAITFGDFGLPVSVSAPPASETFTLLGG
jgi:hypothetical protein